VCGVDWGISSCLLSHQQEYSGREFIAYCMDILLTKGEISNRTCMSVGSGENDVSHLLSHLICRKRELACMTHKKKNATERSIYVARLFSSGGQAAITCNAQRCGYAIRSACVVC
jgi:hypothetical protein